MRSPMPAEIVRLRIADLRKAVLVTGQAYQEPKDALNEFVSNAADEYAEAGRRGARITVVMRRRARRPVIAVSDDGRGLAPGRLRDVARNLFESAKAGDERTLGEKAIGILAYQQLGGRCDLVSRAEGSDETWRLTLSRGEATAQLVLERRRTRPVPGTTAYISDLEPEVLRVLTMRKVVDYLRTRRGPALARGDYEIEVVEGQSAELVAPDRPSGIHLDIPPRSTLWGRLDASLWVAPRVEGVRRRVAVVGRAGTTIVDDIADIEDFACEPWTSDQVAGMVVFPPLQQSAGRRAVLRDRDVFPVFLDAVKALEPRVTAAVDRVAREVDERTSERLADEVRRIFGRVLRELDDVANPMRTALGQDPGLGALLTVLHSGGASNPTPNVDGEPPSLAVEHRPGREARDPGPDNQSATPTERSARLPTLAPDPHPGEARSRYDPGSTVVYYNASHPDYLLVKNDEGSLLEYLVQLVAKEFVVYNNPRASADAIGEDMVRMLVRLRRHIQRNRSARKRGYAAPIAAEPRTSKTTL